MELVVLESADVNHAENSAVRDQGRPEERLDALLAKDRVEDVGVVDVVDHHRALLRRDSACEPAPDRDPHALLDLLLESPGRARHELVRALVKQQDGAGIGRQDVAHTGQELVEQVVGRQVRQRRVGDDLQAYEKVGGLHSIEPTLLTP